MLRSLGISTLALAMGVAATACSDVGDSSAVPSTGGDSTMEGGSIDATAADDSETGVSTDATNDGGSAADALLRDAGTVDSATTVTGAEDAGVTGPGTPDAGGSAMGMPDAGAKEAGAAADAGDAGTLGVDAADAGMTTEGGGPTSGPDAGDAGAVDSGQGGTEGGGGGLRPCTVAGDMNCVQCQYNDTAPRADGTCTPTEATIVQYDIDQGHSPTSGASGPDTCYGCLAYNGCLDDTEFADMGHECEDSLLTGTASECEATLSCILGSACASASVSVCYCGTAGLLTTCQGNPAAGPINGACASAIAAGLGFSVADGTDNTAQLTSTTFAAGKAVQIFQCAITNACTACQ